MATQSSGVNLGYSFASGAVAYVVGLVATVVIVVAELSVALTFLAALGGWQGYLYAHLLIHQHALSDAGGLVGDLLPFTVFMAIILVAAGYVTAARAGGRRSGGGFLHGASIAVGFGVATLAVLLLLQVTGGGDFDVVATVVSVIVTGILYPVVFGGIGGVLADRL